MEWNSVSKSQQVLEYLHKNERMHYCMKEWVEEWGYCHPAWIRYLNIMIKSLRAKQSLNILKYKLHRTFDICICAFASIST